MGAGKDKNTYLGWHFGDNTERPEFVLQIHHDARWHYSVYATISVSKARSLATIAPSNDFDELFAQELQYSHPDFYAELLKHPDLAQRFRQMFLAYPLAAPSRNPF